MQAGNGAWRGVVLAAVLAATVVGGVRGAAAEEPAMGAGPEPLRSDRGQFVLGRINVVGDKYDKIFMVDTVGGRVWALDHDKKKGFSLVPVPYRVNGVDSSLPPGDGAGREVAADGNGGAP